MTTKQIAYYDPGVGTFASAGAWTGFARWLSRTGGLIWGAGLRENLGDAYLWLMQHWEPGDRVYVFGFSRGAFTARALVGMLRTIGLMRPGSENQLQYAVAAYARKGGSESDERSSDEAWKEIHRFSGLFARKVDGRSTIPVTLPRRVGHGQSHGTRALGAEVALHPVGAQCRPHPSRRRDR